MKTLLKHLSFVIVAILLSACGADKDGAVDSVASANAQLSGTFAQACKTSGAYSVVGILAFSGNVEVGTTNVYTDTSCSTLAYSFTLTGTFASGAATSTPPGATKLDVVVSSATLTPHSANGAAILNNASFCGLTNWASGMTQNIVGRSCDGRSYNVGSTIYTVYSFFDSALFMGQITAPGTPTDGSTDLSRPTTLGAPFIKH